MQTALLQRQIAVVLLRNRRKFLAVIGQVSRIFYSLTLFILGQEGDETTSALLAFALLLLIPYAGMKLIAGRLGEASRSSMLGPIDRVLGFGFGAIKGSIVAVLAFSILVLGYDTVWGYQGRPIWMTSARTYPVVNAASKDMVELIAQRRAELQAEAEEAER